MDQVPAIDVHAHVFNAGFALREAVAIGWAMLRGAYPRRAGGATRAITPRRLRDDEGWRHVIALAAGLLGAAFGSAEAHVAHEAAEFRASEWWSGTPLVTAPLMMDIYFALHDNGDEAGVPVDGRAPRDDAARGTHALEAAFRDHVEQVRLDVIAALGRPAPGVAEELEEIVGDILREADRREDPVWASTDEDGVEWSPGYRRHLKELVALRASHGPLVRPFLAVDPRRRGVMEIVRRYVDPERGPFVGVKVYPPQGYLPTHPDLAPVLAHCAAHRIPVTAHASPGGFPTARRRLYVRSATDTGITGRWETFEHGANAARFFSDPTGWRPVLDRHPDLALNLAHFGGADDLPDAGSLAGTWAGEIVDMLECGRYPNLHTDLSFYPGPGLVERLGAIIDAHPVLERRLLFGTDYVMVALDPDGVPLRGYFDRWQGLPAAVRGGNARRFLDG
jgi:predicted TIM-barrel fold metal-dependent hydrolase